MTPTIEFFKKHKEKIQVFIMTAVGFGTAMGLKNGFVSGAISGVIFSAMMTTLHFAFKKKITVSDAPQIQVLKVYLPKFFSYFIVLMVFILGLASFLTWHNNLINGSVILAIIAIAVSLYLPIIGTTYYIGKDTIVKKDQFLTTKEESYALSEITDVTINGLQGVKIALRSGKNLILPALNQHFLELPPHNNEHPVNHQHEGLYRLRDEILRRKEGASLVKSNDELQSFKRLPFLGMRLTTILTTFAILGSLSAYGIYQLRESDISKLAAKSSAEISYTTFANTFYLYKGKRLTDLRKSYEDLCNISSDHNCRYAAYLYEIDGKPDKSLALMKKSCSLTDPRSCYNVFENSKSTIAEVKWADGILEKACQSTEYQSLSCCTCYLEARPRRLPASSNLIE